LPGIVQHPVDYYYKVVQSIPGAEGSPKPKSLLSAPLSAPVVADAGGGESGEAAPAAAEAAAADPPSLQPTRPPPPPGPATGKHGKGSVRA
jgi:hypothetical protein